MRIGILTPYQSQVGFAMFNLINHFEAVGDRGPNVNVRILLAEDSQGLRQEMLAWDRAGRQDQIAGDGCFSPRYLGERFLVKCKNLLGIVVETLASLAEQDMATL